MKLHNLSHAALLTFIFLSHTALATKGLDPAQTGDNPTPPSAQSAPAPVQPAAPAQPQSGGWFPWLSSTPATPQAGEAPPPVSSAFTPTASGWTFWPFGGGNPAPASAEPAAQNPAELTPDDGDFVIVPPGGDQSAPSDPHQFPNADTTEPLAEATQDEDDATAFQPPEAAALPPSVEDYPLFARRSDPSSRLTLQQNPLLTGRL